MIGAYLGALVITPVLALLFLGSNFTDPLKLIFIMVELILLPLIFSRILVRTGWAFRLNPMKGPVTNWSFFVLSYTIVGLNRNMFLSQPLSLVPVALIAFGSTFFLGWIIERVGKALQSDPRKLTSLVLLGTLKNYGLAGGLALALFSKQSAVPATVSTVFMIVYVIWLELKKQRPGDHD
jgi:BASS family bile acid:Na+ symporter